jgi:hypothetical protein
MAITITYLYPVNGTTPPTFLQSLDVNVVTALINSTSAPDTAAIVTTNFALPAADISAGWPDIYFEDLDTTFALNAWWIQSIDPNWVGLARLTSSAGTDTVPSIRVKVSRPSTLVR